MKQLLLILSGLVIAGCATAPSWDTTLTSQVLRNTQADNPHLTCRQFVTQVLQVLPRAELQYPDVTREQFERKVALLEAQADLRQLQRDATCR